jgi:hypothetical protein
VNFALGWPQAWDDVGKLAIAYLLALSGGLNREREEHSVAPSQVVPIASWGTLLGAPSTGMSGAAQSRNIQGMFAGIGFVGGAILKSDNPVHRHGHGGEYLVYRRDRRRAVALSIPTCWRQG